jgi:hypothetical protein
VVGGVGGPGTVHADKADDHRRCRAYLRARGIRPRIARRMIESSTRLGRHRWTIERTEAWLGGWRRLRIRYERSSERFDALVLLACSVICCNRLQQPPGDHSQLPGPLVGKGRSAGAQGASADRVGRSLPSRSQSQATQRWPVACVG